MKEEGGRERREESRRGGSRKGGRKRREESRGGGSKCLLPKNQRARLVVLLKDCKESSNHLFHSQYGSSVLVICTHNGDGCG